MDGTVGQEKVAARNALLQARSDLGQWERSRLDALIAEHVLESPCFQQADAVFSYVSVGAEVDTRAIIERCLGQGKLVAVPRCAPGRTLEWYRVGSLEGLEKSAFGILEPPANAERLVDAHACEHPLAIVPGLSFDGQGYRLGYGGGYYDAFLAQFPGVSLGLCRSCQASGHPLPREAHDVPVHLVATEQGIVRV